MNNTSIQLPKLHGHFGRGTNATQVSVNGVDLYYSYQTLVAFHSPKSGKLFVHQNDWGPTTGGHLKAIDGGSTEAKKARLSAEDFLAAWSRESAA